MQFGVQCSVQCDVQYAVWCGVLTPLLSQARQVEQACATVFEMQRFAFPKGLQCLEIQVCDDHTTTWQQKREAFPTSPIGLLGMLHVLLPCGVVVVTQPVCYHKYCSLVGNASCFCCLPPSPRIARITTDTASGKCKSIPVTN